jgi:hypothetical protein
MALIEKFNEAPKRQKSRIGFKKIIPVKPSIKIEKFLLSENDTDTVFKLSKCFILPKILSNILDSSPNKLQTKLDAKFFLLTKIREIKHLINFQDPEVINDFISLWFEKNTSVLNRLSFEGGCTINKNFEKVYIPEIGSLKIAQPEKLKTLSKSWRHYIQNFDIQNSDNKYYVYISYIPTIFENNKISTSHTFFGKGIRAKEFFKACDWAFQEQEKINQAMKITNFKDLSGWGLQGGAPTLGKRR